MTVNDSIILTPISWPFSRRNKKIPAFIHNFTNTAKNDGISSFFIAKFMPVITKDIPSNDQKDCLQLSLVVLRKH